MSLQIYDRRPQRDRLRQVLDDTNAFDRVYRYQPIKLRGGISPIACVTSLSSGPTLVELNKINSFLVSIMVLRENPEEAEDKLDELGVIARRALLANFSTDVWHGLVFDEQASLTGYWSATETEGKPYRFEDIFVNLMSEC